jgi:hypothetical protein
MKTRLLIILPLILFLIPFSEAYASCDVFFPIIHNVRAYDEASVVFFGTVTDAHVKSSPVPDPYNSEIMRPSPEHTFFTVHYILKGELDENSVMTQPNLSVGYSGFVEGETYFVYAYGPQNEVNICTAPTMSLHGLLTFIFHVMFFLIPLCIVIIVFLLWRKRK